MKKKKKKKSGLKLALNVGGEPTLIGYSEWLEKKRKEENKKI